MFQFHNNWNITLKVQSIWKKIIENCKISKKPIEYDFSKAVTLCEDLKSLIFS